MQLQAPETCDMHHYKSESRPEADDMQGASRLLVYHRIFSHKCGDIHVITIDTA